MSEQEVEWNDRKKGGDEWVCDRTKKGSGWRWISVSWNVSEKKKLDKWKENITKTKQELIFCLTLIFVSFCVVLNVSWQNISLPAYRLLLYLSFTSYIFLKQRLFKLLQSFVSQVVCFLSPATWFLIFIVYLSVYFHCCHEFSESSCNISS